MSSFFIQHPSSFEIDFFLENGFIITPSGSILILPAPKKKSMLYNRTYEESGATLAPVPLYPARFFVRGRFGGNLMPEVRGTLLPKKRG